MSKETSVSPSVFLWAASLCGLIAFELEGAPSPPPVAPADARLETYVRPSGEGVFALSLTPNTPQPASPSRLLTIVFDTSASQTGEYRAKGLAALETLLSELTPHDRVALLAVDVTAAPLTSGYVPAAAKEMQQALARLRERVPLGSTDIEAAFNAALDAAAVAPADREGRVQRIAYIGDGMSPVRLITSQRMQDLADRLVKARTPVNCYAVGPRVDLQLLGALAKHSGGVLVLDSDEAGGRRAGGELADAVRGLTFWPGTVELPGALHEAYYRGLPPLRFDRDSVIVGSFDAKSLDADRPLEIRVAGELLGQPLELTWRVTPGASSEENAYLGELVRFAQRDGGLSLPNVSSLELSDLRWLVGTETRGLARLGEQALALGQLDQAERLADKVAELDPSNPTASVIHEAVYKSRRKDGGASGPKLLSVGDAQPAKDDEAADGELLDEVERQERVYRQFLRTEVRNVINHARQTMGTDPEQAVNVLKLTLEKVAQTPELSPDLRAQLTDQLEAALMSASRQALVKSERDLQREQVAAEGKARERITRELYLQEEKVDQLMARFDALMDEERYRDAEAVAAIAEGMSPGTAGLRTAELTARMVGYTADMLAVTDARHKGVIDSMYQIELSHIPTPDEPPILYPDPHVWQLLTERRKKYKAVDLSQSNPTEAKIMAALDDKTELEFVDQPLTDVVEYLKERHGIEIQLDSKALSDEGIGSDTPVTRNLKGISLRSALRLMLGELDLTYVMRNEVLMITTKTEAENLLSTKVYPVGDLVIPIPAPRMGMGGMGGRMGGMGGMGMGGMGMGMF